MADANQQIADAATTHAVAILRVEAQMRHDVLDELKRLEGTIIGDIAALPENATDFQRSRLDALLAQTHESIDATYQLIDANNGKALAEIASHTQDKTEQIVNNTFQVDVMTVATTPKQFESIVGDALIAGRTQEEWWAKQSQELKDNFTAQMRDGIQRGEGVDDLVRRVRGTKANGFTDGIMNVRRSQAEALVRTSVQSVANDARLRSYQENQDVIKAIQWLSTLDSRTTEICIALHGKQWSLPDYEPIDHDIEFPGPTAHWNCRSTQIPVTRDWNELSQSGGINPPEGEAAAYDELLADNLADQGMSDEQITAALDEARVSFTGEAVQPETFDSFLNRKGESFQNQLLGVQKAQMWREGLINLTDLIDQKARPLTTDALKALVADNTEIPALAAKAGDNGLGLMERSLLEESLAAGRDSNAVMTSFLDGSTGERVTISGLSPSTSDLSKIENMKKLTVLRNGRTNGEVFTPQEIKLFGKLPNFEQARIATPNGKVVTIAVRNGREFTTTDAKEINSTMSKLTTTKPNPTDRLSRAATSNGSVVVRRTPVGAVQPATLGAQVAKPAPLIEQPYRAMADVLKDLPPNNSTALAAAINENAAAADAAVRPALQSLADANGAEMEGLQYAVKTETSLIEKITEDSIGKKISKYNAALNIKDSVRYTMVFPDESYTEGVTKVLGQLKDKGFEIERVKNSWGDAYYRGINVVLRTPNGLLSELQFHTPESLAIKENESHAIYDAIKELQTADEAKHAAQIEQQYAKLANVWEKIAMPQGATGIRKPGEALSTADKITTENIMTVRGDVDSSQLAKYAGEPERAFTTTANSQMIDLDRLVSTKNELRDAKFVNGVKGDPRQTATNGMINAIEQGGKKRAPLTVSANADGTYTIIDGNATAQAAMLAGWRQVPVEIAEDVSAAVSDIKRAPLGSLGPKVTATASDFGKANVEVKGYYQFGADHPEVTIDLYNRLIGLPPDKLTETLLRDIKYDTSTEPRVTIQSLTNNRLLVKTAFMPPDAPNWAITERIFDADGTVEHSLFSVPSAAHGQGIGRQVIENWLALYDHMGVQRIELHANLSVGGYAWARFGFLPTSEDWPLVKSHIRSALGSLDTGLPANVRGEVMELLKSKDPATIRQVAALDYRVTKGEKELRLGQALLLDSDWMGELSLTDPVDYNYLSRYISGGK